MGGWDNLSRQPVFFPEDPPDKEGDQNKKRGNPREGESHGKELGKITGGEEIGVPDRNKSGRGKVEGINPTPTLNKTIKNRRSGQDDEKEERE